MITSVKAYLIRFNRFLITLFATLTLSWLLSVSAFAKVNTSPLFIQLSDAMSEVKRGENAKSLPYLTALQQQFLALSSHNSAAGKKVNDLLAEAISSPNLIQLENLSKALYAFEKEQNPVDFAKQRQQFAKRVMPVYQQLKMAVEAEDLIESQTVYKRFNSTWSVNERVVRETSLGHYGKVETAMTLLRSAMLSEPVHFSEMKAQVRLLGEALRDFQAGNTLVMAMPTNAPNDLISGIQLLEKSYDNLVHHRVDVAKQNITLFIQQWAIFEGKVRTRDSQLYNRVESELPVIMAQGDTPKNLAQFQSLITDLKQLDIVGHYSLFDAMLILLREGLEALLIIIALATALNAANQSQAKRWIYAGAGLGIIASVIVAIALQQLFPALTAGTNREILEGGAGVIAVFMMLFVGAWLHSKSSVAGWQKFVNKQVTQALATGSLFSMLTLSFLSVFREGAETILFYVGMLPLIQIKDLLLGILLALGLLLIIAWVMMKSSKRLPVHALFKVMTVLIYGLGFKILGVSIHALQLTKVIPTHIIDLPHWTLIGLYPSWEGIIAQLSYLLLIPIVAKYFRA